MAFISPTGQTARLGNPLTSTNTPNSTNSSSTATTSTSPGVSTGTIDNWHIALLWFLGAVAMLALAGVAPSIATWIMAILIVLVLFAHWNDTYKHFLGLQ